MGNFSGLWKIFSAVLLSFALFAGAALGMGSKPGVPHISVKGQNGMLSANGRVGAVFMNIENSGSGYDTLLSAKSSIPGSVAEIHDVKNGKMVKGDKIDIPAGSTVELKPGGMHIMLFKMPGNAKEGTELTLTLQFEKSGEIAVPVKLSKPGEMMQNMNMHH